MNQYDNLLIEEITDVWAKVSYNNQVGYTSKDYIKLGKAVVSVYEVRTGAVCKNGASSNSTGRGAYSHHGGISYWKKMFRSYSKTFRAFYF